ncbi:MAG: hypothetical protein E6I75_25965, partial [Chloroflexi bacterium]
MSYAPLTPALSQREREFFFYFVQSRPPAVAALVGELVRWATFGVDHEQRGDAEDCQLRAIGREGDGRIVVLDVSDTGHVAAIEIHGVDVGWQPVSLRNRGLQQRKQVEPGRRAGRGRVRARVAAAPTRPHVRLAAAAQRYPLAIG